MSDDPDEIFGEALAKAGNKWEAVPDKAAARIAELEAEVARLHATRGQFVLEINETADKRIAELEERLKAVSVLFLASAASAELEADNARLTVALAEAMQRIADHQVAAIHLVNQRNELEAVLYHAREVIVTYVAPDARSIIAEIDAALAPSCISHADRLDAYADKLRAEAERELGHGNSPTSMFPEPDAKNTLAGRSGAET